MPSAPTITPKGEVETHHTDGEHLRADELGNAVVRAAQLRHLLWGTLALLGGSMLLNFYLAAKPAEKGFYIEVERDSGRARVVGRAEDIYPLLEASIVGELKDMVGLLRRNIADKEFMQEQWKRAFFHRLTPRGQALFTTYATGLDPLNRKDQVQVEILRTVKKSEQTYDVRWQESTTSAQGEKKDISVYSGLFTWVREPPATMALAEQNALGFKLDTWSFSKE